MDKHKEAQLASIWNFNFKNAMIHKAPYTKRWLTYLDAYRGDYFKNESLPDYKSNAVSNYIFSIIETIRPIMLDNDPKFQAMPRQPEGMEYANDVQEAFSYEWDREKMNLKLYRELINTLVIGTSIFFIPWDSEKKNVKAIPVNPFNLFPDPLATSVDDAEYLIYATYKNVECLKRLFPKHAQRLVGGSINYSELVQDNDKNATIDNQVLVLEVWTRDYENEEVTIDGKNYLKPKYPNGRVITICPELGIVLDDKHMPYKDKEFPFVLIKDYDLPNKFWGEGEVAQLLSPQKHMNDLNNAIIDNAKTTANSPWIIDKNSGIGYGKITTRPGLILRKNPGSEVKRMEAPQMPMYVTNAIDIFKNDMEQISGVHNTLKGENATGVYTAQGILALQEAGQVRIRLKVKLLEESLALMSQKWYSRMKQYWKEDKWFRITRHDGSYDLKLFKKNILDFDYDIKVTAGSTMPVNRGAMLDLMIRLAQTPMPDGQMIVDREAVVQYLPEEIKSALLQRMGDKHVQMQELQQTMEQLMQQIEQVYQESNQNDEQIFQLVEKLTSATEQLNKQILQLQGEHDRIKAQQEEEIKMNEIKSQSYNQGYKDAETFYSEGELIDGVNETEGIDEMEGLEEEEYLPDDILEQLENISDEELALLLEKYPELVDMIK